MSRIATEELRRIADEATPGPWRTAQTTIHGVKYDGLWVEISRDDHDERLICISGSGGSRSYTERVVDIQDHDDNDANARLIALAPQLAAEVLELRHALQRLVDNLDEGDFISTTRIEEARAALSPAPVVDAVKQGGA